MSLSVPPPVQTRRLTRNLPLPYEHVVSVSGGKDSTALYLLALERGMPFTPVFADTGNEHDYVYQAIAELPTRVGGPPIKIVKASFEREFARKRLFVLTKWAEQGIPAAQVERAAFLLERPTGIPFLDLAMVKGRFPGAKSRFCTDELKIVPIYRSVQYPILASGRTVISWQGVRAEESLARSHLRRWQRVNPAPYSLSKTERDVAQDFRAYAYRPIHGWSLDDVWAMHAKHGVPRNGLYDAGASRVGCFPCIFAKKDELRLIARKFPDAIDRVEAWERLVGDVAKRLVATFFCASDDPLYVDGDAVSSETYGIRRRVEWSMTSHGGLQYDLTNFLDARASCHEHGVCE